MPMLKSRRIPSSFVMMVSVSSPGFRGQKLCRSHVCVSSSIVHLLVPTQFYKLRRLCRGQRKNRLKSCTVAKMVRVCCCYICFYHLIYLINRMLSLVVYKGSSYEGREHILVISLQKIYYFYDQGYVHFFCFDGFLSSSLAKGDNPLCFSIILYE